MKFYLYGHIRNDTGDLFYIGKGEGTRFKSQQGRNPYWLNVVNAHGYTSVIIEHFETETEAFEAEIFFIAAIGRKDLGHGPLINMSDGGEGASGAIRTEEQKKRYSEKTWMRTEAGKASMRGDLNPSKRPDVRLILSEKNPHRDPAIREKGAATFRAMGIAHPSKSDKHRKLMRENNPAKRDEVRKKISESRMGQPSWNTGMNLGPLSDDHRSKISQASKKSWSAKKESGEPLFSPRGLAKIKEAARQRSLRQSKGTYITPKGSYELIAEAALANGFTSATIVKNCVGYKRDGKSYAPKLGWSFLPKA